MAAAKPTGMTAAWAEESCLEIVRGSFSPKPDLPQS